MKKKIILGFLVLVILLCFLAQSWALDWKRAQQRYYEHPEQDMERVIVTPQSTDTFPLMIKFIYFPNAQSPQVVIYTNKSQIQAQPKVENSTKSSTNSLSKTR